MRLPPSSWVLLLCVGASLALAAPAACLYPGGTWWNAGTRGYSFWQNFLCDLARRVALDGRPNLVGARLGQVALLALVAAFVPFWPMLSDLVQRPTLAWAVRVAGGVSIPAMAVVILLPSDRFGVAAHGVAVVSAVVLALVAAVCGVVGLWAAGSPLRGIAWLGAGTLVVTAVDFGLYAGPLVAHKSGSSMTPAIQKIALGLLVIWMTSVALHARPRDFL